MLRLVDGLVGGGKLLLWGQNTNQTDVVFFSISGHPPAQEDVHALVYLCISGTALTADCVLWLRRSSSALLDHGCCCHLRSSSVVSQCVMLDVC